jgi:hypothetical protein
MVAELLVLFWMTDKERSFCDNCRESLLVGAVCNKFWSSADVLWMLQCPTSTIGRDHSS